MNTTTNPEPLTGLELIEKVKQLGNLSKEEKARECGYYTMTKNGIERVNMMKFLNALIDAEGIDLDSSANGQWDSNREMNLKLLWGENIFISSKLAPATTTNSHN